MRSCRTAGSAQAQQVAANTSQAATAESAGGIETVVVTGTAFDPESAPRQGRSLETMQPQTIINKSYIEDSVAETGTYTSVLAIAPSMTGTDLNGPGLSDNGVKNTLRGLPDGSFGLSYDGVPFGDTNGPTHHSESYFPVSIIGAIAVDRGPGNAGTIGPSTYGGTVSLFSEALTANTSARVQATAGSWGTSLFNANYQTGDFSLAGLNNRLLLNYQDTNTTGYLTHNSSAAQNYTVKFQTDIAPGWTATLFGSYNGLFQQLEDNAGATAARTDHIWARAIMRCRSIIRRGRHLCALQPCSQEDRPGLPASAGRSGLWLHDRQHLLHLRLYQQDPEHLGCPADSSGHCQGHHRNQRHHHRRHHRRWHRP